MKAIIPAILGIFVLTAIGVAAEEQQYMEDRYDLLDSVDNFNGTDTELLTALENSCRGMVYGDAPVGDIYFNVREVENFRVCIEKERVVKFSHGRFIIWYRCLEEERINVTWATCSFRNTAIPTIYGAFNVYYNHDTGYVYKEGNNVYFVYKIKFPWLIDPTV